MNRILILLLGAGVIAGSYMAVLFGLPSASGFGSTEIASIALPALTTALAIVGYVAWDARERRSTSEHVSELSAQLVRKDMTIEKLSTVDELTGLYTRRHFDTMLRTEFERAKRHQRPLALLLLEVDDIVELGEHVGKVSKGYLLSELGGILRRTLRANDVGCRYNGDNLALLLPETGATQSLAVAEKIRQLVAKHEFLGKRNDGTVSLTVSQGIAVAPAAGLNEPHDFVKAAEQTLAEARLGGFNQVKVCESEPMAFDPSAATEGTPETPEEEKEWLAG